ncbi:MAG: endoflagellar filament sheath protein [Leptospiraceae bacterium]|nr:endoflagellar filament sheath protein [Leptospiraceae bacterium]MCP5511654.1 endoflagellar filament sheath protein [Leptospiraceae bacterium]
MNMKKLILGSSAIAIATASFIGLAFAEKKHVNTSNGSDLSTSELRAITLESWDETAWEVFTDKDGINYTTYPSAEGGEKYNPDLPPTAQAMRSVKLIEGSYSYPRDVKYLDNAQDKSKYKVLGIKFQFTYPGNNEVTIRPTREDKYKIVRYRDFITENDVDRNEAKKTPDQRDPKATPNSYDIYGLEFPGLGKALSVWVCARGAEYDLEGWIEDYKGDTHILKFGSLNFVGWRPMTVKIPSFIPQSRATYPATRSAVFKQFKIRSNPKSTGDPVILFFDELRLLTDTFEVHFDGANLDFDKADCDQKNRIEKALQDPTRPARECKE